MAVAVVAVAVAVADIVLRPGKTIAVVAHDATTAAVVVPVKMIKEVAVVETEDEAAATGTEHVMLECRTLYLVKCGACAAQFEVRGCRLDDLSGFDLENGREEACSKCGHVSIVQMGD